MAFARRATHGISSPTGRQGLPGTGRAVNTTLLELVRTIGEITDDETEIVATVIHMLRSGTVRLTGNFRDTPTDQLLD